MIRYRVARWSLPALLAFAGSLNGCAWREVGPCTDVLIGEGGGTRTEAPGRPAADRDVSDLESRIAELERQIAETRGVADSAMTMAEKALKCCRKDYSILYTEDIYFDFNKTDLTAESDATLDKVADRLKQDPDLIVELAGFTDAVGATDYNIVLGQKRSEQARQYLINKHKINLGRLAVRTFGKSAAVQPADADVATRKSDRRVTVDILGYEK